LRRVKGAEPVVEEKSWGKKKKGGRSVEGMELFYRERRKQREKRENRRGWGDAKGKKGDGPSVRK